MLCFECGNCNIVFTCHVYTHIHIGEHTHTHTHTHTHAFKFCNFLKDRKIKYTSNWDSADPQNVIHRNSCFLMKTEDLRKLLGKLREIN